MAPSHRIPAAATVLALVGAICGCNRGQNAGVSEAVMRENILGTAYLGQQNWTVAEAAFRKALALRADDPLLLTNIAVALIQQGQIDRAAETLRQVLTHDPGFPWAHYDLGLIDNQNGEFASAAAHFEVVARSDPQDLLTQYYLGATLSRIGREDEAIAAYRRALELNPAHVSTLYGLGRLLMQRGDDEQGRRLITRSQEIRARSGLDQAVGGQYGEQGPYAMGIDYPGDALAAPSPINVRFKESAREAQAKPRAPVWTLAPLGAGGAPVLLVAEEGTLRQSFGGPSRSLAPPAPDGRRICALQAGDVDQDGRVELVALLLDERDGSLRPALLRSTDGDGFAWQPADAFRGDVEARGGDGADLTLVDSDHDGDLDLFWCWTGSTVGCKLATGDGSGRFETATSTDHGFGLRAGTTGPVSVAFSDADNDRDVDLLVASTAGVLLFSNQRDGTFEDVSERIGLGSAVRTSALAVADVNKDGWMDLAVEAAAGLELVVNHRGRFEPPTQLRAEGRQAAAPAAPVVFDFDNDGFLDLAWAGDRQLELQRNLGAGKWEERPADDGRAAEGAVVPLTAFDADADGDLDLVVESGGGLALWTNEGGNAQRWIELNSRGGGDNKFGIGAKVEILAGGLRQKFEITRPVPLHAGLGGREQVQSARYLWPSGVLQDEVELRSNGPAEITQLDRKGTSCPLLYAWRDGRWRFVTDFLGGCAIGYQHAPGVFGLPDTDEYVRIEGGLTADDEGRLRLRLNNQLEEVIWFDKVELVVVDHPAGTQVYPNERLMPGPPWPRFELFASSDVRSISAARGVEDGRDLTDLLRDADRRWADDFALLAPKGYATPHTLELDLGLFPADRRLVLLLDGWIDYADSSANIAAAQVGLDLTPPRLFVADGRGGWEELEHVMGFPAGLPKTMAVELTGRFPSADHRVRIATNMRIHWDRARVLVGGERTPLRVTRLPVLSARLEFGGFPRETSPDGRPPFGYDPDDVASVAPWKAHVGAYTSFGDVRDLVDQVDDRFVTTRGGDQIVLEFRALGAVDAGSERTFLLYADGFGKDMDPNSAASSEIGPLPFHGMPGYPYPPGVAPPAAAGIAAGAVRYVWPSDRGWPGALPQALAAEAAGRRGE